MTDYPILLTGTVNVQDSSGKIICPEVRKQQYQHAVLNWIEQGAKKIVFCENSGTKISSPSLLALAKQRCVEFEELTFESNTSSVSKYGKGYGEGEIIRYALENSSLMQQSDGFFKVTGRVYLTNFSKINNYVVSCNANSLFYALRDGKIDTRFFFVKKELFLDVLVNTYENVRDNEGFYLEHAYFQALSSRAFVAKFCSLPQLKGLSGSTGNTYELSKLSFFVRNFIMAFTFKIREYR